ncbi:hypothetical protein [Amycolatopsis sp. lyj-346]|uniref:hypothetical protein n=1 Tax=Amycolatopsis sp. lyj-346 TaxID=2789289 RepID=UPI00397DC4BF
MSDEQFTKGHLVTLAISASIGIGFGAGWWFSAVAAVPDAATALRLLGAVVLVLLFGWVFLTARRGKTLPSGGDRGSSPFGKRYGIAVTVMVVAIFGGSRLLSAVLDLPEAVPAWILLAVGLHFIPFARLFGSNRFLLLSALLCAVAILAVVLGAAGVTWAWRLVPGFGGALVLWAIAAGSLLSGTTAIDRQRNLALAGAKHDG